MCVSGCDAIFPDDGQLDKVTCPCGRGYWDIWKAAFVSGDEIRAKKAPPKEEYVARVKAELTPEKYDAKIKQQYISHFLECKDKRLLDDKATREGRNDGSSLRRALTYTWEYERGDFRSNGTSQNFDTKTLKAIWSRLRGSPVTDDDIRPLLSQKLFTADTKEADGRDRASALLTTSSQATMARHSSISDQTPRSAAATGTEGSYRSYFIPKQDIRQDVLDYHCKRGTFGQGATAQPHKLADGRHGFSVRSTIAPTVKTISLLKTDSAKVDDTGRKSSKSTGRSTEDDRHESSRNQNTSIGESPNRHSSDTMTRSMDTMTISSTHRRQAQYTAPNPSRTDRSTQSSVLAYAQSAQGLEPRHPRDPRDSIEVPSAPLTYLGSSQQPQQSRHSSETSERRNDRRSVDDATAAKRDDRPGQAQTTSVRWLCCHCDGDPQAWPDIKRCLSCGHAKCQSCGVESTASASIPSKTTLDQEAEDSPTESPPDSPARISKDNTRRSSKTDRHYDKKKESRDRRR